MIILKNILGLITDPKNTRMFLLGGIIVLCILLLRQCQAVDEANREVTRIENNWKASLDTIKNYIDADGNAAAEIRALNLTLDELNEELEYERSKPPITVIKTETVIKEVIVEIPVTVIDTVFENYTSAINLSDSSFWGKSSRSVGVFIPYDEQDHKFGNATIDLNQNIWLTAALSRNTKTKELFVNLSTDYPGTTFNDAKGILVNQESKAFKDLQYQHRKTLGLGIQIGAGYGIDGVSPFIGFGLNYTPKFFQW